MTATPEVTDFDVEETIRELTRANEAFAERETLMRSEIDRLARELAELRPARRLSMGAEGPVLQHRMSGTRPETGPPVPIRKDMSLQNMVACWSGEPSSVPVSDFLRGIELVALSGNWEDPDKALVARMRLKGTAAAFLASRPDLQAPGVPFGQIKTALEERFRDHRGPEQYFMALSDVRQMASEAVRAFADRCRLLGEKAISPEGTVPEQTAARRQIDRVVLAAFLKGLAGEVGRTVRLNPPSTLNEAVERAAVAELELGQTRSGAFVAVAEDGSTGPVTEADSPPPPQGLVAACYRCGGPGHLARQCRKAATTVNVNPGHEPAAYRGTNPARPAPRGNCYRCDRPGHFARNCPERGQPQANPNAHGPAVPRPPVRT